MITYEEAMAKLQQDGQEHVLAYYDELDEAGKQHLLKQIEELDFSVLTLADPKVRKKTTAARGKITPLTAMELPEIEENKEHFKATGLEAIRAGKVGAVLLAGGMGTRLGSDNPKCMYDIGITHPVYIMQRLIENTLDVVREADGHMIPFFIMTSKKNDALTREFLKEHDYFGYDPSFVYFFEQEMAPACDYNGRVYMEEKDTIATSPNGNGGWFTSMNRAGLVDTCHELGIEYLNCFAVDNVLQRIADPVFVGAMIEKKCACASKVVRKVSPDEKVGAMCLEDGKPSIIEYYDMTPELKEEKNGKGDPAYNFGVILNYLFSEKDLEKIMNEKLTVHVVEKKIPYLDPFGNHIKPESPNGYKFEQLILDMIHEMDSCLPFEVDRKKEFAPIKNRTGVDSVESARELCKGCGISL